MANTIGKLFRLTTFGESHGVAVGGIIDGCPAGLFLDEEYVQKELDRRKPGQSNLTTARKESDTVAFLSGVFEGKTTGTPIAFVVKNENQHSSDYESLRNIFRPSHADYTYQMKYGVRDHRGGGRSSARETVARVVGGAVAKLLLRQMGVEIYAYTSQVGEIALPYDYTHYEATEIEKNAVRCPDEKIAEQMAALICTVKEEGDTVGGVITCVAKGVPVGWGEPAFGKLHAELGGAILSINACKGFAYGQGFDVSKRGSEQNDSFYMKGDTIAVATNNSGGIQGGISNGETIYFKAAFKPVATLLRKQKTITKDFQDTEFEAKGRHDACVLPRAVPVVEAMTALVLVDAYLQSKAFNHE